MNPSPSSVSDLLNLLRDQEIRVNERLLIGEKVDLIQQASEGYQRLQNLVTPYYFLDEEFVWLKDLGNNWNNEVQEYRLGLEDYT